MFVKPTPNSELIKELQRTEKEYKISETERIKFVEKSGVKIKDIHSVNDPFRRNCPDEAIVCLVKGTINFKLQENQCGIPIMV